MSACTRAGMGHKGHLLVTPLGSCGWGGAEGWLPSHVGAGTGKLVTHLVTCWWVGRLPVKRTLTALSSDHLGPPAIPVFWTLLSVH